MPPIKVLVPLDGSVFAERALHMLQPLRALGPLYVRLVGAIDEGALGALPQAHDWEAREERLLREHLQATQSGLQDDDILAGSEVLRGRPADVILAAAERFEPDYILISSHGRSGVERWRAGSVADEVIRRAVTNVLVVGPSCADTRTSIRNVMVALDGSGLADAALPSAREIAAALDARLHLVRVVTHPLFTDDAGWAWRAIQDSAQTYLDEINQSLGLENSITAMPIGAPPDELLEYCQQQKIDLTVLTTHGRSGLIRMALGSVTEALLTGRTPVLVVKKAGG